MAKGLNHLIEYYYMSLAYNKMEILLKCLTIVFLFLRSECSSEPASSSVNLRYFLADILYTYTFTHYHWFPLKHT